MKRYHGEETVRPGLYLDLAEMKFVTMDKAGRLPGASEAVYRKVPAAAMLVAGPIVGAAYVMFLPMIGFAMLAAVAGRKGLEIGADVARAAARVIEPSWEPGTAFLSRRKRNAKHGAHKDEWAEDVKAKIAKKGPGRKA